MFFFFHKNVSQFVHAGKHDKSLIENNVSASVFPSLSRVSQPSKFLRVLASVTVALQILTKGEVVDDWFQLRASHSRTEAGTVRIKARYMVSFLSTKS